MQSRRDVLEKIGVASTAGVAGAAALSGTAAAGMPGVDWEPADPSNYTDADRGAGEINWIVFHTMQGSASDAADWIENPESDMSLHFIVADDGHLYQCLPVECIGKHVDKWNYNEYSIGIGLGGYVSEPYPDAQYQMSADLSAYLCERYDIPKQHQTYVPYDAANPENGGIIGHEQVPGSTYTDPGDNWDWNYFINFVNSY